MKSSFDVGVIVTFSNPQLSSGEPTLVHIALHVEVPAIQNFRLDSGEVAAPLILEKSDGVSNASKGDNQFHQEATTNIYCSLRGCLQV